MRLRQCVKAAALAALLLVIYGVAINRYGIAGVTKAGAKPVVLAHRCVHQTFDATGLDRCTGCSADRIHPPQHGYLENTVASIAAAFRFGADIVELDLRGTSDGHVVVFHDSYLECRTDGSGRVDERDLDYLRKLDLGYGYTSDGGATYPFRGSAVGELRTLDEILKAFPDHSFSLDFKDGGNRQIAQSLIQVLTALPVEQQHRLYLYAIPEILELVQRHVPAVRPFSHKSEVKRCARDYLLYGWIGIFPDSCADRVLGAPADKTWVIWGYPHVFMQRVICPECAIIP